MPIADTRKMILHAHHRVRQAVAVAAVSVGALLLLPTLAGAAFPGTNGDIAFVTTRNNNVNIQQVNPSGSGVGTPAGDLANTTPLTAGSVDAEPFYSPDGTQVVFSSNRSGRWAIYEIGQTDANETVPATEISQVSGQESHDDYGPSFSDNGNVVVFNRDNTSIDSVYVSDGASSVCDLYNPAGGLAAASADNGAASRIVFDPADPTKLVYVAGNNQIHLLSGLVVPTAGQTCPTEAPTDVNLSVTATGNTLGPSQADANPDWSPDGTKIIFDSTRSGGHSLWYFTNPTSLSATVTALWPSLAGPSGTTDTQPVFSPDGTHIAYTQPVMQNGTQVIDYESDTFGAPQNNETDLTLGAGSSANSQPDWQPISPFPNLPEAPLTMLLPGSAILVGGGYLLIRSRRRLTLRPLSA